MMDLNQIPKSFWHSASVSLLALTFGFIYISYSFGDLQVKFKDLEVRSTAVVALEHTLKKQEENIAAQEKTIADREAEVDGLNTLLQGKISEIKALKDQIAQIEAADSAPSEIREIVEKIEDISKDNQFDEAVAERREAQTTLQAKHESLQRDYASQREVFQQIQQQQVIPMKFGQQQLQQ